MLYNISMIALCLTNTILHENTILIERNKAYIDMIELRLDFLTIPSNDISKLWNEVESWIANIIDTYNIEVLCTARVAQDGGQWQNNTLASETMRIMLLKHAIKSPHVTYVDIEQNIKDFGVTNISDLLSIAQSYNKKIILSSHQFEETQHSKNSHLKSNWIQEILSLSQSYPNCIIKTAIDCNSTSKLCDFFEHSKHLKNVIPGKYIIVPMGMYAIPGRVLTALTGALWTYASESALAHLGQINPKTLADTYRYKEITSQTSLYGIIGDPVMHSQSPDLHNSIFTGARTVFPKADIPTAAHKIYIHLPIDDCSQMPRLASLIHLKGFSVTLPYKQDIINYLHTKDEYTSLCQSCNTVIIKDDVWHGYNTDIPGALTPLNDYLESISKTIKNLKITIIGAGGTAAALSFGLAKAGAQLLIVNRTVEKSQKLAEDILSSPSISNTSVQTSDITDYKKIAEYNDIILQTTNVGMNDIETTPLPKYPFLGTEIIYDVIYNPECTLLMQDAAQQGCHTISGKDMFITQGILQAVLFSQ